MGNNKIEAVCHKPVRELESPQSGCKERERRDSNPSFTPAIRSRMDQLKR
jgi:hypothetical protein